MDSIVSIDTFSHRGYLVVFVERGSRLIVFEIHFRLFPFWCLRLSIINTLFPPAEIDRWVYEEDWSCSQTEREGIVSHSLITMGKWLDFPVWISCTSSIYSIILTSSSSFRSCWRFNDCVPEYVNGWACPTANPQLALLFVWVTCNFTFVQWVNREIFISKKGEQCSPFFFGPRLVLVCGMYQNIKID